MKYVGENSIKKLISLIKGDLNTKQDAIEATGVLERDTDGAINGVETVGATLVDTQEATLVDVPNGLLKGDGTTISAAVAGTDYVSPDGMNEAVATAKDVFWATLDSTYAEVKAAYDAGKIIKFGFMEGAKTTLEMEHFDEDGVFWFRGVKPRTSNDEVSGVYSLVRFKLSPNGSWAGLTTINLPSKAEVDSKLSLTGGTMTGELDLSGSTDREITKLFWNNGIFNLSTGLGDNPQFKFNTDPLGGETTLSSGRVFSETGSYYGSSITLNQSGVIISGKGGDVEITNVKNPTADTDAANKTYVDTSIQSAIQATWEASY